MFTKEDILARLQNGDSVDEIAKEMSDVLNAAHADYESAKQVDAKASRVMEAKRVAVDNMLDAVCDYLVASGEGDLITDIKDIETDKIIELFDDSIKMAKSLEKLKDLQFPLFDDKPIAKKIDADKAIMDFLKGFDL